MFGDNSIPQESSYPELTLRIKHEPGGKIRCDNPFRPNSDAHSFTLQATDGEHGAWYDHVSQEGGSLYDLATRLGIPLPEKDSASYAPKKQYTSLADYAAGHGVAVEVFAAAGWRDDHWFEIPSISFPTANGTRHRLLTGKDKYKQPSGYKPCWYGLERAVKLAGETGTPLVLCNGEASVVVAQHHHIPAAAITNSGERPLPEHLLEQLRAAYDGPLLVALDCDDKGRKAAPLLVAQLAAVRYEARAIDLLGSAGDDLADFCRLHGETSGADLLALPGVGERTKAAGGSASASPAADNDRVILWALRDLLAKEFPPTRWIVPGVLPEGTTLLVAKPKIGKSWLALNIAIAVASGGVALGQYRVDPGDVLYLGLEDGERRMKTRTLKVLAGEVAPENFTFAATWPKEGDALTMIEDWIKGTPNPRLIVVDTLAKVRGQQKTGQGLYEFDYQSVEGLQAISTRYPGVSIVIVHHARKADAADALDTISGSTAVSGGVDNILIMKRERGAADASLYVTGRDIEEDQDIALLWHADIALWQAGGDAEAYRISRERTEIIELLQRHGDGLSPKEIAETLERDAGAIRRLLNSMIDDGQVNSPRRGFYTVSGNNGNSRNDGNAVTTVTTRELSKPRTVVAADPNRANRCNPGSSVPKIVTDVTDVTDDRIDTDVTARVLPFPPQSTTSSVTRESYQEKGERAIRLAHSGDHSKARQVAALIGDPEIRRATQERIASIQQPTSPVGY